MNLEPSKVVQFLNTLETYFSLSSNSVVGHETKGRISKRVFEENKARQIFRKTSISYPLIRTRFEIRLSALLPTMRRLP